eukprot:4351805-Pleurochrysis_carterae.AAC.1
MARHVSVTCLTLGFNHSHCGYAAHNAIVECLKQLSSVYEGVQHIFMTAMASARSNVNVPSRHRASLN